MPPAKKFYKIGEVVDLTGLEPHALRSWESDFPKLKPKKNSSGHRVYSPENIELIEKIKHLIQVEGYTAAGAAKRLQELEAAPAAAPGIPDVTVIKKELGEVRTILENLKKMLDREA